MQNTAHYKRENRRKLTSRSGKRCECCVCGEYFNTTTTFDMHRVGKFEPTDTRRCLAVDEMKQKGFTKTNDDYWLAPANETTKAFFKGRIK